MATEKDVLKLFITEAAFVAGSKQRQMGYDKTTKRMMIHNNTDDTLASAWSDDTLQVLLSGTQIITGLKSHSVALTVNQNIKLLLGGEGFLYANDDNIDLSCTKADGNLRFSSTESIIFRASNTEFARASVNGIRVKDTKKFFMGDDEASGAMYWTASAIELTIDVKTAGSLVTNIGASEITKVDAEGLHTTAFVMTGRLVVGVGGAASGTAVNVDVTGVSMLLVAPNSGTNEDFYALTNKVDGQVIFFYNTESGGSPAQIDMDTTNGVRVGDNSSQICRWDATLNRWVGETYTG